MQSKRPFTRSQILLAAGLLVLTQQSGASSQHIRIKDGSGPVERCDQLEITFDAGPALRAEETLRVPVGEALTVLLRDRGGVGLREAPVSQHEITICKAVPPGAEKDLATIGGVVKGSLVEVVGPKDSKWATYLLVASPRGSEVSLTATNGPIRVDAFEGRLDVRSVNGPIALARVRGQARARAQNGPITLEADGGQISIETQNGPIGVRLTGDRWQSGRLEARAQNGPLSVAVPVQYRSGLEIESTGHGPWSCRGVPGCDAVKDRTASRRLLLGSGPTQVRLSTANGPVKVLSTADGTDARE